MVLGVLVCATAGLLALVSRTSSPQTASALAEATLPETRVIEHLQRRQLRIVPEYQRRMQRVVVCIPESDSPGKYHEEILSHLPDYTEIDLLVPNHYRQTVQDWLDDKSYRRRIRLIAYDPRHRNVSDKPPLHSPRLGLQDRRHRCNREQHPPVPALRERDPLAFRRGWSMASIKECTSAT